MASSARAFLAHSISLTSSSFSSVNVWKQTSSKTKNFGGKGVIVSGGKNDGDRCTQKKHANNTKRRYVLTSTLAALTAGIHLNTRKDVAYAKFAPGDDDDDWIVNPKRIKVENEPDGYKPNEYWTEAKKDVEIANPPPEPLRDPKEVFRSTSDSSTSSNDEQQEEESVIEIDIDLVEPGYIPTSQEEVDEKTLKQAVNNARIQQYNNAPDDFPTFVRDSYDVQVVTPRGYDKTEDGLMYYDFAKGSGKLPGKDQEVTFHYVAYNENGGVIDSTYRKNTPAKARLGMKGMIPGFEEGLSTMKPGGKRRIIVPPELGPPVGPATFFSSKQWEVFDIELLDSKSCSREGGLPGGFGSSIVCN